MKKTLFAATLLFSSVAFAQKANIQMANGKEYKVKTESKQNMTMSMGMEVKSETESKYIVKVTKETPQAYEFEGHIDKLKIKSEVMGQSQNYDSDNAADKDSQLGQILGAMVGKKGTYGLNRSTGEVSVIKAPDVDTAALRQGMGGIDPDMIPSADALMKNSLLTSVASHKPGDKWTETVNTPEGLKSVNNYTYQSNTGSMANLLINSVISGKMQREAQGMTIDVDMNSVNEGTMNVDTKTFLVSKSKIHSKIDSKMQVMGQEMTMTGTADTETSVD